MVELPINNRRRLGLLGLAMIAIAHGFAFLLIPAVPGALPAGIALISGDGRLVPAWGAAWLLLGLIVLGCAVLRKPGWGPVSTLTALSFFWGCGYLGAVLAGTAPRGYVLAAAYIGLSLLVLSTVPARKRRAQAEAPE